MIGETPSFVKANILDIRKAQLCKLDERYMDALWSLPVEGQDQDEEKSLFSGLKLDT